MNTQTVACALVRPSPDLPGLEQTPAHVEWQRTTDPATGRLLSVAQVVVRGPAGALPPHADAHACASAFQAPSALTLPFDPALIPPPSRGYAARADAEQAAAPSPAEEDVTLLAPNATAVPTATVTSRELSFLDDKKLSIEEKLFRFMVLVMKKADQDLVAAMKRYSGKKPSSSSGSSEAGASDAAGAADTTRAPGEPLDWAKDPNGLYHTGDAQLDTFLNDHSFGFVGDLVEGVGDVLGTLAEPLADVAEVAARELGGPLLAAAVTACGFPQLAPLALKLGGVLASEAVSGFKDAVGVGRDAPAQGPADSASDPTAEVPADPDASLMGPPGASMSASNVEGDEKLEFLNLQRMVEKQNAMFAALSNTMKSLHEAQMIAIQNIR